MSEIRLHPSWLSVLESEFNKPYFNELKAFLKAEKENGKRIFPPGNQIFAALDACPFEQTRVVIIGQDPYHGFGQANGLCFSVNPDVTKPPSLVNIFVEIKRDMGGEIPKAGDLTFWANQGVLLLNAVLTVEAGMPGSHQNKGWERLTDKIINVLNSNCDHLVFMLWGGYANKKGQYINRNKHLVLECGHPSPLSANRGYWFGNKHFSKCNAYLIEHGRKPIDWIGSMELV